MRVKDLASPHMCAHPPAPIVEEVHKAIYRFSADSVTLSVTLSIKCVGVGVYDLKVYKDAQKTQITKASQTGGEKLKASPYPTSNNSTQ